MVLKESFTYQNVLTNFIDKAYLYLSSESNITKKTQTHNKKKVYSEAENETIVANEKKGDLVFDNTTMVRFLETLMNEKISLINAISMAKRNAEYDVDALIESNKIRQRVSGVYKHMSSIQSKEKEFDGVGYKWDQEGKQTPYKYPISEVTVIDFDRNVTKKLTKDIKSEADNTSTKIDTLMATIVVDFTPTFDVHDTFEDAYETFVSLNKTSKNETN